MSFDFTLKLCRDHLLAAGSGTDFGLKSAEPRGCNDKDRMQTVELYRKESSRMKGRETTNEAKKRERSSAFVGALWEPP